MRGAAADDVHFDKTAADMHATQPSRTSSHEQLVEIIHSVKHGLHGHLVMNVFQRRSLHTFPSQQHAL